MSSSLSTGSSLSRPCRFSCRFSFLLGVYGTKSSSLRRKTTGSSLTQKKITSCSGSRRETTVKHQGKKRKKERGSHFLLGATGNNLLSDRGSAPHRGFGGGPPYNFVNFISIMVSFLAAVSTGMLLFFPSDTHNRNFLFAQSYVSATAGLEHLTPQIFTDQAGCERPGRREGERVAQHAAPESSSDNDEL